MVNMLMHFICTRHYSLFKSLATTNPIPVKAALQLIGWSVGPPRSPLVSLNSEMKEELVKILFYEIDLIFSLFASEFGFHLDNNVQVFYINFSMTSSSMNSQVSKIINQNHLV